VSLCVAEAHQQTSGQSNLGAAGTHNRANVAACSTGPTDALTPQTCKERAASSARVWQLKHTVPHKQRQCRQAYSQATGKVGTSGPSGECPKVGPAALHPHSLFGGECTHMGVRLHTFAVARQASTVNSLEGALERRTPVCKSTAEHATNPYALKPDFRTFAATGVQAPANALWCKHPTAMHTYAGSMRHAATPSNLRPHTHMCFQYSQPTNQPATNTTIRPLTITPRRAQTMSPPPPTTRAETCSCVAASVAAKPAPLSCCALLRLSLHTR
jgi:hypothetical protein